MEVSFYDVAAGNLIPTLVRLLEKIFLSNQRCVFFTPLEERLKVVDKMLWTFSTNAFVPHGDKSLGFSEHQPIYFTSLSENPNHASVLVMTDSFDYQSHGGDFQRIIFFFEGEEQRKNAQELHETLKKKCNNVNYWRQSPKGWEKVM